MNLNSAIKAILFERQNSIVFVRKNPINEPSIVINAGTLSRARPRLQRGEMLRLGQGGQRFGQASFPSALRRLIAVAAHTSAATQPMKVQPMKILSRKIAAIW